MSIGILYESEEWSNTHLAELIAEKGVPCCLIHMEHEQPLSHELYSHYVNRVFPSAFMRGHHQALSKTAGFLRFLDDRGIPVTNSSRAFMYDCSKDAYYRVLADAGVSVPPWACIVPEAERDGVVAWKRFPALAKHDCGGRSYQVAIFNNADELSDWSPDPADVPWIIQEFIPPAESCTVRIEIVGECIIGVFKRHLGENSLSSYSRGSAYSVYTDCPDRLLEEAVAALRLLEVEMGGMDYIQDASGKFHLIDINPSSNFTPDLNSLYGFDPVEKMAEYIVRKWKNL